MCSLGMDETEACLVQRSSRVAGGEEGEGREEQRADSQPVYAVCSTAHPDGLRAMPKVHHSNNNEKKRCYRNLISFN